MDGDTKILVWDSPTRLFHWLLATSFTGAFLTGDTERWRDIHLMLGYSVLGLIGFRLVWGFIGSRHARFASFSFRPAETWTYLTSLATGRPRHYVGHNPVGALAIFGLLGLGAACGVSGLAISDLAVGEWLEEVHEASANAMLALVGLHLIGVFASSLLHGENLVLAMITGRKSGPSSAGIAHSHRWMGALLLAAVIGFWAIYPSVSGPSQTELTREAGDDPD